MPREVDERVIRAFRAGGPMGGMPRDSMLLLTTVGRRSGRRRTTPMMCVPVGDALVVVASNSGADRNPDWYLNLVADPHVEVETGGARYDAEARAIRGEHRAQAWTQVVDRMPMYAQHQERTSRQIPLVELVPSPDGSDRSSTGPDAP